MKKEYSSKNARMTECGYADVKRWRSLAGKERVAITNTPGTRWFRVDDIAVAGLLKVGEGLRIKGVWVDPAYRGTGIGTALTEHLIEIGREGGAHFVEAYALNPGWYYARGFADVGKNGYGVMRVRLMLLAI